MRRSRAQMNGVLAIALFATAGCNSFCNRRVFEQVEPTCDATIASDADIPTEKAADILIVVDNSGSMQEEQDRLAAAFVNEDPSCPLPVDQLKDFARCDDDPSLPICEFANPTQELLDAELSTCGFIQVLAAFENDFRIGVITTDIGQCDNRFAEFQASAFCQANAGAPECGDQGGLPWGFHPQRGCLQPNGPPGTPQKILSRADLESDDPAVADIGGRFARTLQNIRTFGTPIERGLDAAQVFLDKDATRAPGCEGDLDSFLREDAKLVMIFLTDEEDCSRLPTAAACTSPGCTECPDGNCEIFQCEDPEDCKPGAIELAFDTCTDQSGEIGRFFEFDTSRCYSLEENLTRVAEYTSFFRGLKADPNDVTVATIAGGLPVVDADGDVVDFVGAGCKFNAGNGGVPVGECVPTGGSSNTCEPEDNCCFADSGDRYYELADQMNGIKDTICVDSFSQTMIKIAVFIADVDFVDLAEEPENPAFIFVEKAPADSEDFVDVPRLSGDACNATDDGWVLETPTRVRFCGTARPGPGERVRVRAKGQGADPDAPAQDRCANRGVVVEAD
jgi:hypothetical protein